jgi:hypothetical protein
VAGCIIEFIERNAEKPPKPPKPTDK